MKQKLVVLSGAGISAESGLGTFRDSGGLWEKYNIEDVATPEAWAKNPQLVTHFYNMRRKNCLETSPNHAHFVLAELEKLFNITIITQNIDDLHERAGSKKVIHLHGKITQAKSSGPNAENKYYNLTNWEIKMGDTCNEGYQLRPHVVWFGEAVPMLDTAATIINDADLFLVIGTSLNVYPAASLIHACNSKCAKYIIDPNAEELSISTNFEVIKQVASTGIDLFKQKITVR